MRRAYPSQPSRAVLPGAHDWKAANSLSQAEQGFCEDSLLCVQSVSVIAFMSTVLSCLACLVHAFVLNLLCQQNSHLPPCDPSNPLCVETYNLLLVL